MKKKILLVVVALVLVPVAIYAALVCANNFGSSEVATDEVATSLERSTQWLMDHRDTVLDQNNPMLWWMIQRSAKLTRDYRLETLFKAYQERYLTGRNNYWRLLFDPGYPLRLSPERIASLPDYNQYFFYGLSCSKSLESTDVIQRQLTADFCSRYHPVSPACVTHQMMGLAFRQRSHCGDGEQLAQQMKVLQQVVHKQLTWDPRVVDVYMQRILMLVDTGAGDTVKGRWLNRLLKAQLADGSWSGFQPLLPLGGGRYLGFNARGVKLGKPVGSLHTTAQGVLLMSLLTYQQQDVGRDR